MDKSVWVLVGSPGDLPRVFDTVVDAKLILENEGWRINRAFKHDDAVEFYQEKHRLVSIRVYRRICERTER